jgi:hypothetical protein
MPVTKEEIEEYKAFAKKVATDFGCLEPPPDLIWHYTDGDGLLAILKSGCLHATQIAALNDKNETRFGSMLYRKAIENLLEERGSEPEEQPFLAYVLEQLVEESDTATHGASNAYVSCFSGHRDELTQWERYGRKHQQLNWGYALGFDRHLTGAAAILFKVIYSHEKQEQAAAILAKATLDFYLKGLSEERRSDCGEWRSAFFYTFDGFIYPFASTVKEACWSREDEYRIYSDGRLSTLEDLGFKQRHSMLSRYLKLKPPVGQDGKAQPLPIREIMIGPGNHPEFTKLNLTFLLQQLGYGPVEISHSDIHLWNP